MDRMTAKMLDDRVETLNTMLGYDDPNWNTVGSFHVGSAYGGYRLERVVNTAGGISDVTGFGYGTRRDVYNFVKGMISGIYATKV